MFLAPLAIARLLVSIVGVVLAWLIILFTLLGQHPTKPLPKWKEVVSRSTLKVTARVVLWACAGGKITVEVGSCCSCGTALPSSVGMPLLTFHAD